MISFPQWKGVKNLPIFRTISSQPNTYLFTLAQENEDSMGLICSIIMFCVISVQLSDYCQYCGI